MRPERFTKAPYGLRRRRVHLDNIALVPASLLPYTAQWQAIANDLLSGETLIVLPLQAKQQRVAHSVAVQLRGKGQRVRVMKQELLTRAMFSF